MACLLYWWYDLCFINRLREDKSKREKEKKMIPEFLSMLHTYGIPALIDLLADVGFIILVPAVLYYVWHQTRWYNRG